MTVSSGELTSTVWDAVIVGAGPAGCHAAWELGRRRRRVLLVDRAAFPRWKPCAGGITLKAAPFIPAELHHLFERPVKEMVIGLSPHRVTRIRSRGSVGWMVHRETFDPAHLDLVRGLETVAIAEGYRVLAVDERAEDVLVSTSAGAVRCGVVLGCDGVESVVARAVPGSDDRRFVAAYEIEGALSGSDRNPDTLFDLSAFPGGYGWIFAKRGRCSVGGYVDIGRGRCVRERCDRFVAEWPDLRGFEPARARGCRLPLGGTRRRLNTSRVLLAGDAADTVDPVTGEGIAFAFMTAHWAADAVDRFLAVGETLDRYGARVWRRIHRPFRFAQRLSDLLYAHPGAGFRYLFRNRLLCAMFVRVIRGEIGYAGLVLRAALASPLLPAFTARGNEVAFDVP